MDTFGVPSVVDVSFSSGSSVLESLWRRSLGGDVFFFGPVIDGETMIEC